VRNWLLAPALLAIAAATASTPQDLIQATRKIDAIKGEKLRPGTGVVFTLPEFNAWVGSQVPSGVRDARLRIDSPGVATGTAIVDIAKVSRAEGFDPGWLLTKLLEGERPVRVTARIRSARGSATVEVQRVDIGGLEIDGKTLELLIQYVIVPMYPNAVVGHSFELGHNIDHFELQPNSIGIVVGQRH
jgi:hypothetical protein